MKIYVSYLGYMCLLLYGKGFDIDKKTMDDLSKGIVVFDVDGTLFDTKPGIFDALEDVFKHFDIGYFDRAGGAKYIGPPVKESLMRFNGIPNDIAESATMYYRQVYVDKYIVNSRPYKGIQKLLYELLKTGYGIAIATNKTFPQVDRLLSTTGMKKTWFKSIKTALETGSVDKRGMLKQIRDEYNVPTIIMVGDTNGDRLAAEGAGVGFIGVTYGYGLIKGKENYCTTVDNPKQLINAIRHYNKSGLT